MPEGKTKPEPKQVFRTTNLTHGPAIICLSRFQTIGNLYFPHSLACQTYVRMYGNLEASSEEEAIGSLAGGKDLEDVRDRTEQ